MFQILFNVWVRMGHHEYSLGLVRFLQARSHLERGSVEELIDTNLLLEPCNMDVMLKMGLPGLRCVVTEPKQRFHDTSSWRWIQELCCGVYQRVDTGDGAYDQLLH
uniref:Probable serine/threonine-protein kinase PBL11 n=1 Tax=Tanacetum cinerariifolium TaxID=118510 RepID=A0A6L2KFQ1_TANCI|nr:probable serine/threonine-protein kinase PBL11 [Tanacetum cinerariifolium]